LRIAVLSDLNGSYGSTSYEIGVHDGVATVIGRLDPAIVLITGDMVAGQQAGLDYAAMWSAFHAAVTEPLHAAGVPLAVTPGNHDASGYSAFAAERAIFVDEWKDPARIPPVRFVDDADYPLRYSFTHEGAFFLSLDATVIGPLDEVQRAWVDAQLALAADYPVKIAFGHIPIHAVTQGRETETLHDQALETIFRDRGLTMYVSGHHHGYYPGARDGLRLVSTSCLGAGPRALLGEDGASPKSLLQIDVVDGAVASLEALMAPGFDTIIERATLPSELDYQGDVVLRDDLAGF
jgi:3',5'-cyclic AMP phosphodiesterase CpdA